MKLNSFTTRQVANLRKVFVNYLSADIKLLKIQLSKIVQSRGSTILIDLLARYLKVV